MKLSTKVRYGLRAVIELAISSHGKPVLTQAIAQRQGIPKKYLENLLIALKGAGIVRSIRGSKGGYILAKPPSQITAKDVVEAIEGPIQLVDCVDKHSKDCDRKVICAASELWEEVSEAIKKTLEAHTIEELAKRALEKTETSSLMYYI